MAAKTKLNNVDKLNAGLKSIINELEVSRDKVKLLEDNHELYNEIQCIVKSLLDDVENINCATQILNLHESLKNEKLFYLSKTGISVNTLPENIQLQTATDILLETGIDDYNSNSLFSKYMSMIEKCSKEKELMDDIDQCINKLKIVTEQQNDLKCGLSNITYMPVGYTAELIPVKSIENVQINENCAKIVELMKKIANIEKKQLDICKAIAEMKSEQKKMYHGLPPSMDKAIMAVQIAEKTMKSVSKKLVEKL